jgi:hypothetical protein
MSLRRRGGHGGDRRRKQHIGHGFFISKQPQATRAAGMKLSSPQMRAEWIR